MRGNFLALGFFKVISQILRLYIIAFFGTLLFVGRVIFGMIKKAAHIGSLRV